MVCVSENIPSEIVIVPLMPDPAVIKYILAIIHM